MKVRFFTLGCKVNQYETQGLIEEFEHHGWQISEAMADLYIINTCTVTKRADVKSKEAILRAKKENPKAKIAVCGCLANYNRDLIDSLGVDYIVPQDEKYKLFEIVNNFKSNKKDIWGLKIAKFSNHRAFLKVQDGCDNSCSYCKIPHLRGPSKSRDRLEIIDEVKRLGANHPEVILCGINLALWGRDFKVCDNLARLISRLLKIESVPRIRLSSLEPAHATDELISLLTNDKICSHLHFPFQNGDDEILKLMNKNETALDYLELVEKAKKIKPSIAISCDIMVGFPGEEDSHFENTINFLEKVRPMRMHIFRFSPREKTKFAELKITNQQAVRNRMLKLQDLADKYSYEYKKDNLGKTLNMVTEEQSGPYIIGHTENYLKVHIKEKIKLGIVAKVKLLEIKDGNIMGELDEA